MSKPQETTCINIRKVNKGLSKNVQSTLETTVDMLL